VKLCLTFLIAGEVLLHPRDEFGKCVLARQEKEDSSGAAAGKARMRGVGAG
jgi:hypothetical protein